MMFGSIGIFEVLVLAAVGLLVLGPEQFPKYAKMAARFVRDIRSYANEVQTEIVKEMRPVTKEFNQLRNVNPESYLDKLAGDDASDASPANPEPHPSEVDFGEPAKAMSPEDAKAAAAAVSYGSAGSPYPQEPNVPPTPTEPERLDG